MNNKFKPILKPFMYGYVATRDDGIDVEVVRCYSGQWNVFLTVDGQVIARSIREHELCGDGYLSYQQARQVAGQLLAY